MSDTRGLSQQSTSRIAALRAKHAALEEKIAKFLSRPSANDSLLRQLKKEKLALKEQLEGIRQTG